MGFVIFPQFLKRFLHICQNIENIFSYNKKGIFFWQSRLSFSFLFKLHFYLKTKSCNKHIPGGVAQESCCDYHSVMQQWPRLPADWLWGRQSHKFPVKQIATAKSSGTVLSASIQMRWKEEKGKGEEKGGNGKLMLCHRLSHTCMGRET